MQFPAWTRLVRLYEREIARLFPLYPTEQELYDLANSQEFQDAAYQAALSMVSGVVRTNAKTWRQAASQWSRGRTIYEALQRELHSTGLQHVIQERVRENAQLITSVPLQIAQRMTYKASLAQQSGMRAKSIEKELRRAAPQLTANRIRMIARTEISKAETAVTRARAENLGLSWGQWLTSEDQRVRPSHRNLDKVLLRFTDPPQPEALIGEHSKLGKGLPGEFPYCRCILNPLVSLDQIRWPARCYTNGRIFTVTRAQFERMNAMSAVA